MQTPPIHSQRDAIGAAAQSACDLKHVLQGGFGHAHGGVGGGAGPLQIVQLEQSSHEPQRAHEQSEPLPRPGWQSQNGPFRVAQDTPPVEKAGRANMPQLPADSSSTTTAVSDRAAMLWRSGGLRLRLLLSDCRTIPGRKRTVVGD